MLLIKFIPRRRRIIENDRLSKFLADLDKCLGSIPATSEIYHRIIHQNASGEGIDLVGTTIKRNF